MQISTDLYRTDYFSFNFFKIPGVSPCHYTAMEMIILYCPTESSFFIMPCGKGVYPLSIGLCSGRISVIYHCWISCDWTFSRTSDCQHRLCSFSSTWTHSLCFFLARLGTKGGKGYYSEAKPLRAFYTGRWWKTNSSWEQYKNFFVAERNIGLTWGEEKEI